MLMFITNVSLHTISGNNFLIFATSVFQEKIERISSKKIKDKMKEQNIRSTVFSVSEN